MSQVGDSLGDTLGRVRCALATLICSSVIPNLALSASISRAWAIAEERFSTLIEGSGEPSYPSPQYLAARLQR
jgi:hypothetical protein